MKRRNLKYILIVFPILISLIHFSCISKTAKKQDYVKDNARDRIDWFPKLEPEKMFNKEGFYFIKGLKGYQQTTEYTSGAASLLSLAAYYKIKDVELNKDAEMKIAKESGTRSLDVKKDGGKPGIKPEEMGKWLETHGFDVKIEYEDKEDGSALNKLKDNIIKGIPTIVEWIDLGGIWTIVVGYDTRGNDDPWDDVLIFADPYDKYDGCQDGYSYANANKFYWLWFDVFYFDKITYRTMITAIPKKN